MAKYPEKCTSCGGNLEFVFKERALVCPNCGNHVPVLLSRAKERDYNDEIVNENSWKKETRVVKCEACGAIDVLDNGDLSDVCPFCGSTNVVSADDVNVLKPTGILPFEITKQQASANVFSKIKKSFWAPKKLKQNLRLEGLKPIYTPCFTFDANCKGYYNGRLGKNIERRVRRADGSYSTVEEIRWFNVSGQIDHIFNDILINAGQKITAVTMSGLEPYNTENAISYDKMFLQGAAANHYSKNLSASYDQAKIQMRNMIEDIIVKQYDADEIGSLDIDIDFSEVKFKYLLLPVYTTGFNYGNKGYNLYVNGSTGEVVGKLPVSKGKVWGTVLGVLAAIGAVALAVALL